MGSPFIKPGQLNFAESTRYEYFFDPSLSTTTSTGWVNKLQVTTNQLESGRYLLVWGLEIGQSDNNSVAGFRVRWREDGVTAFAPAVEIPAVSFRDGNTYIVQSNAIEIQITGNNTVTVQAQFGQADSGGTARIRNVIYYIFKVGDL